MNRPLGRGSVASASWNQLTTPTSPPARTDAAIAYDPNPGDCGSGATTGCVVLFGGCGTSCPYGDTWVFYGGDWHTICTTSCGPTPVYGAGMVYDAADGYVLLSGGDTGSNHPQQTWKFAGGVWTQLNPSSNAGTDSDQLMVYDPRSTDCGSGATQGCVVMFAGWNGASNDYGTWAWQGNNNKWVQTTTSGPSGRSHLAYAYDAIDGYVLLYGGGETSGVDGDTWEYANNVWTQLKFGGVACGDTGFGQPACGGSTPGDRQDPWMTFDSTDGYPVLFGGCSTVNCGGSGNTYYSDTWAFSGGTWSHPCSTCGSISGRAESAMVYDAADQYVVLFGGTNGATLGETWVYGPAPSVSSFTCSPIDLDLGGSVACTTIATGGVAPLSYSYTGTGCTVGTSSSYTCSPPVGTYTPTVTVTDAVGRSATASSLYSVLSDPSVTASAAPSTTDAGSLVSFRSTPSGGQPRYTESWQFGSNGNLGTGTGQNITFSFPSRGNFTACVNATDSLGKTTASPACTLVLVNQLPAIAAFTASPASILLGAGATLTVSVYGGTGSLSYAYVGLPPGCVSSSTPSLSCTPTSVSGSPFTIHVYINDSVGRDAQANTSLIVASATTVTLASVTATPNSANMGPSSSQNFIASALDTSGAPIYSGIGFTWSLSPGTLGSLNATSGSVVRFTSGVAVGTGTLTVTATYGTSSEVFSVTITVSSSPPPLSITSFAASPAIFDLGYSTSFQVVASGGSGSLSYYYSGLPTGCSTPATTVSSFSCSPTSGGTYNVSVTVADQAGHSAQAWLTLTVLAATHASGSATDWTPYILAAAVVVAIVVVLAVLLLRRRRSPVSPLRAPDPSSGAAGPWSAPPAEPPPDPATAAPYSFGAPTAYYTGVTFAQAPEHWSRDPSQSYGTYQPTPPPAPEPLSSTAGPNLTADAYRPWALRITPEGIDVEEIGHKPVGRGQVQDAEFHPVEETSPTVEPQVVKVTPAPADAYVILYGLAQRPRSLDAIKQMVPLTDDAVSMLIQALEKAKLVAHGTNNTTRAVMYAITPAGRQLTKRALMAASEAVKTETAALPAPVDPTAQPGSTASKTSPGDAALRVALSASEQPAASAVGVGGFQPQDVNPKAQNVPQQAYQAWSADILGGTANVHEIGGKGAMHEAEERERIRKLLESWKQRKGREAR